MAKRANLPAGRQAQRTAMFYVYVLKSDADGSLYIGMTSNLRRRLREHARGASRSTRAKRPLELMLQEHFATRSEARQREKFHKSGLGRELLKSFRVPQQTVPGWRKGQTQRT